MTNTQKQTGASRNPDFEDGLVVWNDEYAGRYEPVIYGQQFDDQWRLFLERRREEPHNAAWRVIDRKAA